MSGDTNWHVSGETVEGLAYGLHSIQYGEVEGWEPPPNEQFMISSSTLTNLTRTYTPIPEPTSIRGLIVPQGAIDAGARWRVGVGEWHEHDEVVQLAPGSYSVSLTITGAMGSDTETQIIEAYSWLKGDVDGDGDVDLNDVIAALRAFVGIQSAGNINMGADVDGNGLIGIKEAIYALQVEAGLRQ